jgi:hypothetical protein
MDEITEVATISSDLEILRESCRGLSDAIILVETVEDTLRNAGLDIPSDLSKALISIDEARRNISDIITYQQDQN